MAYSRISIPLVVWETLVWLQTLPHTSLQSQTIYLNSPGLNFLIYKLGVNYVSISYGHYEDLMT